MSVSDPELAAQIAKPLLRDCPLLTGDDVCEEFSERLSKSPNDFLKEYASAEDRNESGMGDFTDDCVSALMDGCGDLGLFGNVLDVNCRRL